ncbi:MAG: hypothetical protein LBC73_07690 [Oscillospiraceae bacterium]|jgi:hypothetical protein|nr:hypothetical protein [Oscillospiraceae bacterium]
MKKILLLTLMLAVSIILVACGGLNDSNAPVDTPSPSPTDTPPPIDTPTPPIDTPPPTTDVQPVVFDFANVVEDAYSFNAEYADGNLIITIHDQNIAPVLLFEDWTTLNYSSNLFNILSGGISGEINVKETLILEIWSNDIESSSMEFDFDSKSIIITLKLQDTLTFDNPTFFGSIRVNFGDNNVDLYYNFYVPEELLPEVLNDERLSEIILGKWVTVDSCSDTANYVDFRADGIVVLSDAHGYYEEVNWIIEDGFVKLWSGNNSNSFNLSFADDGSILFMGQNWERT